jgi:signal transduction histidine kinase
MPDGAVAWEEVHSSPVLDANGKPRQVVEVWRDISDRRAAEANLAESHRLASIGYLASGFSHELNTPLANVLMCVEGILREKPGDKDVWTRIMDGAGIAREQVLRCRLVTQHFLRMARGQPSSADIVDLARCVSAVARLIEPTAREHSVRIVVDPVPSDIHLRADEAGLQDVLINLLLNAIQASPSGSEVRLCAEAGANVRVRVSDRGCGIASADVKRIFEPFFGLRKGGTGLGLFLSLNFARRWGGDLLVESVEGRGSTFELVLPAPAGVPFQEVVQ